VDPYIFWLIILGLFTAFGYFRGRKKNAWISGWISTETERVLKPKDTEYTNFGGTIGYNFVYRLKEPLREAKGTFTLLPRHSILYLPISLVIARHDRYYLTIFTHKKLIGEGHIINAAYYGRMRTSIDNLESFQRLVVEAGGAKYILLWDRKPMQALLRRLVEKCGARGTLLHFCCYRDNRNFFLHAVPRHDDLGGLLEDVVQALPSFGEKGEAHAGTASPDDESGNVRQD
jgi:hypothetical protein